MSGPLRLRHYFTRFATLGGVQSILATHLRLDNRHNLPSSLLAFFDSANAVQAHPSVTGLGLTGWDSIRSARKKFRRHESGRAYDIPIYHDLWGLAFFGDRDDRSFRRLGAVHSQWPYLDYQLAQVRDGLDGIFTDSESIAEQLRASPDGLAPTRIRHLPVPAQVAPETSLEPPSPLAGRPLIVGYVGRLDYAQKRVDRLPELLQTLREENVPCELQILGDGAARKRLSTSFPADAPVRFWGRQSGESYWRTMARWDFVISTSDHEGSPLALIESLSLGNVPLFPKIGSGGDALAEAVDPGLLYAPGDWRGVAETLKNWQAKPFAAWCAIRDRCRQISRRHSPESYHARFREFLNEIVEAPKVSRNFSPHRPFRATDYLPFGILSRYRPQALYHANPPLRPD